MEVFGNQSSPATLSEYQQRDVPGSVWKSLAQQKTTAAAKGMQEMGAGVSHLGGAIKGALNKAENENPDEQNISFMRNDQGMLVPTSSGDGGFLFGASGPSQMPSNDGVSNLFNSIMPESGSAEALGAGAHKTGAVIPNMQNMAAVSTVSAANVVVSQQVLGMRQKYEGNPDGFNSALFEYANSARAGMGGGKAGDAIYNQILHVGNQHYASLVSDQFTRNKNEAWDNIGASIKQDTLDAMSYARQFPGDFEKLKESGPYQKVLAGYKSLNMNPIFNGKMTGGKMTEAALDFERDMMKSHAIGYSEKLRDQPGGSVDVAQDWLNKNYKAKGLDDVWSAANSHLLWKSEAQKDAIQANQDRTNTYMASFLTGQGVPTKEENDAAIRYSQSVGDFSSANRLKDGWDAYQHRNQNRGLPPQQHINASFAGSNYPGQPVPASALPNLDGNYNEAIDKLGLNAQEQYFYNYHRRNLANLGKGGFVHDDGSVSTVIAGVHTIDGRAYILPSVWDGKEHKDAGEIIKHAEKQGLSNFPNYGTVDEALKREKAMHNYMEKDVQAVGKWKTENPKQNVADHGWDASQLNNSNLHLFGSRGSGYGAINLSYKGGFDDVGKGGFTPNQAFTYLKGIGASDNEARMLIGASMSESGLNPNVPHDNHTGWGLFGHKISRLDMRGKNWQEQYGLALNELRHRPEHSMVEAAKSPDELARAQMFFERPLGFTEAHPENGHNYTGRRNTLARLYGLAGGRELPAIASAGDVRTGARPYSPEELASRPYLAAAMSRMQAQDDKVAIAQAQTQMPMMAAAMRQGVPVDEASMVRMQQLADQHPEELGKHWADVQQAFTAHPMAAQVAGMADPQQALENIRNIARSTGDMRQMQMADEIEKQYKGMEADYKDNPQRFGARPDVNYLQRQPPGMETAFATDNPAQAFQTIMDEKRQAGIILNNRFGNGVANNTIMGSDVKGVVSLLGQDAQTANAVLQTMTTGLRPEEMKAFEQNKDFTNAITGLAYSDDPNKARTAFQFMDARWRENPEAFGNTYPKMRERLVKWQSDLAFKSEKAAMESLRVALDPGQQAMRDTLRKEADTELGKMTPQDAMKGISTGWFGRGNFSYDKAAQALDSDTFSAKQVAFEEFKDLYRSYRQNNVSENAARDAAIEDLKLKWNTSELNGGRFMAYPPEMNGHYAPINGSTDWVKQQIQETVSEIATKNKIAGLYWSPEGKTGNYETALVSDRNTQMDIANGDAPSYRILVNTANGWMPLMDKNASGKMKEARFYPDRRAALANAQTEFASRRYSMGLPMPSAPQPAPATPDMAMNNVGQGAQ